jgi:hypothetical protein
MSTTSAVTLVSHNDAKGIECGDKAEWKSVRVELGMDEADWDFTSNLAGLHVFRYCNLVVAGEVGFRPSADSACRPEAQLFSEVRETDCLRLLGASTSRHREMGVRPERRNSSSLRRLPKSKFFRAASPN